MRSLLLGTVCAGAASTFYCLEVAMQALEARAVPVAHGFRPSLLVRLVRRPRWLVASLVGTLGWPLQAGALLLAPLTLVQPALGLGLVLLLPIGARFLGERVGRRETGAVVAVLVGVAGSAWVAPERSAAHVGASLLVPALVCLAVLALAPYLVASVRRLALAGAWSAGFAFAWSGLATKLFSDALAAKDRTGVVLWLVLTGAWALVGILGEMSALQRRSATQVAPAIFAVETLVPVALAPILVRENWPSGWAAAMLAGSLALVIVGAVTLERSPPLAGLLESVRSVESDAAESPRVVLCASTRSRD
jgi:hypothetical protein